MATDDDGSDASGPVWLSAEDIAAMSGGRATAAAVRDWWRKGLLEFTAFPELGTKSNKRSHRDAVHRFLARKYGARTPPTTPAAPPPPSLADVVDTLSSVKAAATAAMEAVLAEAEAHAAFSRAVADADAKRVESLRHLQTMLRGYDLALSAYVQPQSLADLPGRPQH